ncbi:hypothetical protein [Curtobacterium sp. ISL-83]|uniref:hypothetical protein n=1 Tax=Curtobacterium sp. ISL-83 TaxID=2819145 RepID=UPI001BE96B66|nr:hypothetical protein [Curtobacterium sp. ISL-83]MBT2501974.1 hypothetical protein [Curtobacterium sp. ISL-83]
MDLLPGEVHVSRRQRAVVRRVWAGVVAMAVAVGLLAGWASLDRMAAEQDLTTAQGETVTLLQQQLRYRDVRVTEGATTLLKAAQQVGGSTEVDWAATLRSVQSKLPAGVKITGLTVDSASPTQSYAQSDDPLQGARIATLTFDASSSTLPSVPEWLTSVRSMRGFVDANANSVARADDGSGYRVNMTIHLNEKAFDGAYAATNATKG